MYWVRAKSGVITPLFDLIHSFSVAKAPAKPVRDKIFRYKRNLLLLK